MRGVARRLGAGQVLGDDLGRKRSAAGLARLVAQQTIDALLGVSRLPAPDRGPSPEDRSTAKTDGPAGDGQKQLAHAIAGNVAAEIEHAERDAALSRISEHFRTRRLAGQLDQLLFRNAERGQDVGQHDEGAAAPSGHIRLPPA
jgi:hypothetical protein